MTSDQPPAPGEAAHLSPDALLDAAIRGIGRAVLDAHAERDAQAARRASPPENRRDRRRREALARRGRTP